MTTHAKATYEELVERLEQAKRDAAIDAKRIAELTRKINARDAQLAKVKRDSAR